MNNQKLYLAAAVLLGCLLIISGIFTYEGLRESAVQERNVLAGEQTEAKDSSKHHFYFSPASNATPCIGLSKLSKLDCGNKSGVALRRTVVSVSKPIDSPDVAVDSESLKSLNSNASLNLMIENYTVRRSGHKDDVDCDDFAYEFIVETFTTTVEAFMSESASTSIETTHDAIQKPSFLSRLSQYFGARSAKESA